MITRAVAFLYLAAAAVTFGHALRNDAVPHRVRVESAVSAAGFWPLYWWAVTRD